MTEQETQEAGQIDQEADVQVDTEIVEEVIPEIVNEVEVLPEQETVEVLAPSKEDILQAPDMADFNDIYQLGAQAVINALSRKKEANDGAKAASERISAAQAVVSAAEFERSEALKRQSEAMANATEVVKAQRALLDNYLEG